jgi:hypothetical protein
MHVCNGLVTQLQGTASIHCQDMSSQEVVPILKRAKETFKKSLMNWVYVRVGGGGCS